MIKIKLECWWTHNEWVTRRFIKQFVNESNIENFEFVQDGQDYTIVFGRTDWDNIKTPKNRTLYYSQEPLFSPNQPKENIEKYCGKIFIADKTQFPNSSEYIETLPPMLYGSRGPTWDSGFYTGYHGPSTIEEEKLEWWYNIKNFNYDKREPISMIVTNQVIFYQGSIPNVCEIIYDFRVNLANELSSLNLIDLYGDFWPNDSENKKIKGYIHSKHYGLDNYMFSIACENSIQKNYVSEKFWDVILTDTVPIYYGCKNIEEHIPNECYINLNGMETEQIKNKIKEINENYKDIYNIYKEKVLWLKEEFFINKKYNLWEHIKYSIKN